MQSADWLACVQKLKMVRLTRKASLLAARAVLPALLDDVKEGAVLPGFVASVTSVRSQAISNCWSKTVCSSTSTHLRHLCMAVPSGG